MTAHGLGTARAAATGRVSTPAAARQARCRARRVNGEVPVRLTVPEVDLAIALEQAGFGAGLENDRAALAQALERRIRRWIEESQDDIDG